MPFNMEDIKNRLHAKDYKLTPQRKIILEAFTDHSAHHLSAEDVYAIVKEKYPEMGLATVYRTLEILAQLDILQKMNFGDGRSRYELSDQSDHHHHHLICLNCGAVTEFEDDLLESLEVAIGKKTGFKVMDHQLKMYGYCKNCRKE